MPANHNVPHSEEAKKKMSQARAGKPLLKKRVKPCLIDGAEHWECPTCKLVLPAGAFYKNAKRWNGLTSQCRKCHCESTIRTRDPEKHRDGKKLSARKRRIENPEQFRSKEKDYSRKRPKTDRTEARSRLNSAVNSGKVKKLSCCERCGATGRMEGHHEDYSKPLEVIWLCTECHGKQHRKY